jgi:hypothetical protein
MTKIIRLGAGVLCLGVLALGAVALDPACRLLSSFGGRSVNRGSVAEQIGRNEALDQRKEAMRHRREAKAHVAEEVIAGRRSLAEAIEQFRALDREWPDNHRGPRTPEDFGMSQDEWDGRAVLDFVGRVLADRPAEAAAAADRLEKELRELLAERRKRRLAPVEPPVGPSR